MAYQNDRIKQIPAPLPIDYDRQTNFTDYQTANPGQPMSGAALDAEFNVVEQALDETQARQRLIQRDDGALQNKIVTRDSLAEEVIAGVNSPTTWTVSTVYAETDSVIVYNEPGQVDPAWYVCEIGHTSVDFAADLAAGRWRLLVDLSILLADAGQTVVSSGSGTNQTFTDALNGRPIVFDNEADMIAQTALIEGLTVITLGETTPGDGKGQTFQIVASGGDVTLDNGNEALIVSKVLTETGVQTGQNALNARVIDEFDVDAFYEKGSVRQGLLKNYTSTDVTLSPGYNPGANVQIYNIIAGVSDNMHRHFGSIVRTNTGRLIIVYRYSQEHGVIPGQTSSIRIVTNDDEGASTGWSSEVELVPAVTGRYQQGPAIGCADNGRIFMFWADIRDDSADVVDGVSGTYFYLIYSDDDGDTWSDKITVDYTDFAYARTFGSIKEVPAGGANRKKLIATAYKRTSLSPSIFGTGWYESTDNGLTWSTLKYVTNQAGFNDNEADIAWLNKRHAVCIARSADGLRVWTTQDGGTTWSNEGEVTRTNSGRAVAPSTDLVHLNGEPYVLLGYHDRDDDLTIWRVARMADIYLNGADLAFSGPDINTGIADMDNASGYQRATFYPNGEMAFVEFKEYVAPDKYSDVRFGRGAPGTWVTELKPGGLQFSKDGQRYDTNTVTDLADFTPSLLGATTAGSPVYSVRYGKAQRYGQEVTIHVSFTVSDIGGMAGALRMGGLPWRVTEDAELARAAEMSVSFSNNHTLAAGFHVISARGRSDSFQLEFTKMGQTGGGLMQASEALTDFTMQFTFRYITDD